MKQYLGQSRSLGLFCPVLNRALVGVLGAWVVISPSSALGTGAVILPDTGSTNAKACRLVWPTAPGVRYQPQQSPDLLGWTNLNNSPILAPGFSDQYLFQATSNRQFFRVLQIDEHPPASVARYPGNSNFAIPRSTDLTIQLADQSGVDPTSLRLTVANLGTFTTKSPQLTFTYNLLVFHPGQANLGAYGDTVNVALVAADILGH